MAPARVHRYHAEATALHADLKHPLAQEIKPQTYVKLAKGGGYLSEHARYFRVEHVVSYKSAHTHVAGHESTKPERGWITLTTSSIESLNVLEVVTADRVVSQIATHHPFKNGEHVPSVTFLGTKFENLRVGGARVDVVFNPRLFTIHAPAGDKPYLEDPDFLKEMGSSASFPGLGKEWQAYVQQNPKGSPKPGASAKGTLAESVSFLDKAPFPSKISGNVITVPDFGKIILAELDLDCDTFHLTMIRLEMGCLAAGTMTASSTITNGMTRP